MFYTRLADLLAEKKKLSKSIVSSWIKEQSYVLYYKSHYYYYVSEVLDHSLNRNISNCEHDIEVAHAVSMSE